MMNGSTSEERAAEQRLQEDPLDTDAWTVLLVRAQSTSLDDARPVLERFLELFPTAAHYWLYYIQKEMDAHNYEQVEKLFERCLLPCMSVQVWQLYLKFVQFAKKGEADEGSALDQAYRSAIDHVGRDMSSSQIWLDYIAFLRSQATVNAFEESQKITAIRKVFHRALVLPLALAETVWKDYDQWEHSLNRDLAQELVKEKQQSHLTAVTAKRELKKRRDGILMTMLARPPVTSAHGQKRDYKQVKLWQNVLAYEVENPLRLDDAAWKSRVCFVYRQALLHLRYYPEIWYGFARFHREHCEDHDGAAKILQEALEAMPDNLLVHFMYADFEEGRRNFKEAREVYDNLMEKLPQPLVHIALIDFARRCDSADSLREICLKAIKSPHCSHHVVVFLAHLEHRLDPNSPKALKLFSLVGMKKFSKNVAFLAHYIDFLFKVNDRQNLGMVIEKALTDLTPEDAAPIWDRFVDYQRKYGDLAAIESAEKRRAVALRSDLDDPLDDLIDRKHFDSLFPCSQAYLDVRKMRHEINVSNANRRVRGAAALLSQNLPRPDLSQMKKLERISQSVHARLPSFPLPTPVEAFLFKLPGPSGPRLDVCGLMDLIISVKIELLSRQTPAPSTQGSSPEKAKNIGQANSEDEPYRSAKRRAAPAPDLFGKRLAQKMAKLT